MVRLRYVPVRSGGNDDRFEAAVVTAMMAVMPRRDYVVCCIETPKAVYFFSALECS